MKYDLNYDWRKIGKFIQDNRQAKGMSQNELCFEIGITQASLSKVENGKFRPSPYLLKKLPKLLEFEDSDYPLEKESSQKNKALYIVGGSDPMTEEDFVKLIKLHVIIVLRQLSDPNAFFVIR